MNKYRVKKVGHNYYLQKCGIANNWENVVIFGNKESAKEYCRIYNLYLI